MSATNSSGKKYAYIMMKQMWSSIMFKSEIIINTIMSELNPIKLEPLGTARLENQGVNVFHC